MANRINRASAGRTVPKHAPSWRTQIPGEERNRLPKGHQRSQALCLFIRFLGQEASARAGDDYSRGRGGRKTERDMPGTQQLGREMLTGCRDIRQEVGTAGADE